MKDISVKDMMVPLEEYATVFEEATLYEALMALEKAQNAIDRCTMKHLHRAVLVYDENKKNRGQNEPVRCAARTGTEVYGHRRVFQPFPVRVSALIF